MNIRRFSFHRSSVPAGETGVAPIPVDPLRLHLSLGAKGFGLIRLAQWALAVTVVGSIGSAVWLWWDSRFLLDEAAQYEVAAERVRGTTGEFVKQATQAGFDLSEARVKVLTREVAFANQLLEKRTFSWTRFLSHLEEAVPPRVSISAVQLNYKDSIITLNGTALTLKDLTALVNGLEEHAAFRNVVLSQHRFQEARTAGGQAGVEKVHGGEGARTVEFTMTVTYRPAF